MNPWPILAGLILGVSCWIGGYRFGLDVRQGECDAAKVADSEAREQSMQTAAKAIAAMIPTQAKITERVTHEVQTNTVYRDCRVTPDGLRMLNDTISGTQSEPAGGHGMPPASAPN